MEMKIEQGRPSGEAYRMEAGTTGAAGRTEAAPVLGGAGVRVSSATDLQKLMAELKMDEEEGRRTRAAQGFEIVLMRLTAQNGQISDAQNQALAAAGTATDELAAAQTLLADAEAAVVALDDQIAAQRATISELERTLDDQLASLADLRTTLDAKTALLQTLTEELERLVEAQRKTPEEREQEIRQKDENARLADEAQRRIDDLTRQIADLQNACARLQNAVAQGEGAVAATRSALEAAQSASAKAEEARAAAQATVVAAQRAVSAAETTLAGALAALDTTGMAVLADAIRVTAAQVLAVTAEMPERGETDEQAASILNLAEAVVRDIEEHRDEDLDKLVAKLPDALVWLAHAPTTVPSETLPNHEIRA